MTTAADIHDLIRRLAALNLNALDRRLTSHLTRNHAGSVVPDGFPTSHAYSDMPGGGGSGDTSVEAAVIARLDGRSDPVDQALTAAAGSLQTALDALDRCYDHADTLDELADPRRRDDTPRCCEQHCDAAAAKPSKRGRCVACYQWILRWESDHPGDQAPPVPAQLIDDRTRRNRGRLEPAGSVGG